MPRKQQYLRAKIDLERVDVLCGLDLFRSLTDAMKAYQNGSGPAPEVEDFENWKNKTDEALQRRLSPDRLVT